MEQQWHGKAMAWNSNGMEHQSPTQFVCALYPPFQVPVVEGGPTPAPANVADEAHNVNIAGALPHTFVYKKRSF
jgi:hypothetical protein